MYIPIPTKKWKRSSEHLCFSQFTSHYNYITVQCSCCFPFVTYFFSASLTTSLLVSLAVLFARALKTINCVTRVLLHIYHWSRNQLTHISTTDNGTSNHKNVMKRNQLHWKYLNDISGLFSLLLLCYHPLKTLQDALREKSHFRRQILLYRLHWPRGVWDGEKKKWGGKMVTPRFLSILPPIL